MTTTTIQLNSRTTISFNVNVRANDRRERDCAHVDAVALRLVPNLFSVFSPQFRDASKYLNKNYIRDALCRRDRYDQAAPLDL